MKKREEFTLEDCHKTDCKDCIYRPKGHGCTYPQKA